MGDNLIQELNLKLTRIETLLESINKTNDLKLNAVEEKIKVANNRIKDLEDNNRWLWRTVIGALIGAAMALIIKI